MAITADDQPKMLVFDDDIRMHSPNLPMVSDFTFIIANVDANCNMANKRSNLRAIVEKIRIKRENLAMRYGNVHIYSPG